MRLQILSDLHLEFDPALPPLAPGADAVIVAGDLAPRTPGLMQRLRDAWGEETRIVYVPGNHEYYGLDLDDTARLLAEDCAACGVTFLNPGVARLDGITVVGATLWTDFGITGSREYAMAVAGSCINDFRGTIRTASGPFTAAASARIHTAERAFIDDALNGSSGPAVVVTHHAPTPKSIHSDFEGDALNGAFVSDLEDLITAHQPELWIHGHIHHQVDAMVGATRVLANPRGYPREDRARGFRPDLVVEL